MTAGESTVPGVDLLFAGNLPHEATENSLKKVFETIGPVESVRMPLGKNGRSKHIAYIQYRSQEDCDRALSELSEKEIDGRPVRLMKARPFELYQAKKKEELEKQKYSRNNREHSPPRRRSPPPYPREPPYRPPSPPGYDHYYDYDPYRMPPPEYGRWPPMPPHEYGHSYDARRRKETELEDLLRDYIERKSRNKSVSDIIRKIRDL